MFPLEDDSIPRQPWLKRKILAWLGEAPPQNTADLEKDIQELEQLGVLGEQEGAMIESLLEFGETMAREVMVPRTEVQALAEEAPISEVLALVVECGHSRLPVYSDSIDNIIGVLHVKDMLPHWGRNGVELKSLLRPAMFVPATKLITDLMAEMKAKHSHMAVVVDEYGGTAGILTIEDIIEEIVGEIQDEHDDEAPQLVRISGDEVLVDARLDVDEIGEFFDLELPKDGYDTIGGFVIAQAGAVPQAGQAVQFDGLTLTVEEADERRISRIRIVRDRQED